MIIIPWAFLLDSNYGFPYYGARKSLLGGSLPTQRLIRCMSMVRRRSLYISTQGVRRNASSIGAEERKRTANREL
jgi:hypothetical protein